MRLAIVGSGISGLTTAWLASGYAEAVLYEAEARLGGHTCTMPMRDGTGVDIGFIVHNDRNYPNFIRLMQALGVTTEASSMSLSVTGQSAHGPIEYSGDSLNALFAQRRNLIRPAFLRMLLEVPRFNRAATAARGTSQLDQPLGTFLQELGTSKAFRDWYVVPMMGAIWSASARAVLECPARFFVEFFHNHGLLTLNDRPQWRVISGGSKRYIEAMQAQFRDVEIRLSCPVVGIQREADGQVSVRDAHGNSERFDHVVLACHSDQALALLPQANTPDVLALRPQRYQPNSVILHTDASVMPVHRQCWAAWNVRVGATEEHPVIATYWMNCLQNLTCDTDYFVTLNDDQAIDPSRILHQTAFAHPLFDHAGLEARSRFNPAAGFENVHFCGAYWRNGFHEDGVVSAMAVAEVLNLPLQEKLQQAA